MFLDAALTLNILFTNYLLFCSSLYLNGTRFCVCINIHIFALAVIGHSYYIETLYVSDLIEFLTVYSKVYLL